MYSTERGRCRLGAHVTCDGVNFGIFSKNGDTVVLNIFEEEMDENPSFSYRLDPQKNRTGDIWHVLLKKMGSGIFYTWNIGGEEDELKGHKFISQLHIIDPYAKGITSYGNSNIQKAVVVDDSFLQREIKRPGTELEDTIVYEMHVSLFTKNSNGKSDFPGTFRGVHEKIGYLKELGITAVEFMPVFEYDDFAVGTNPITGEKLKNIWGYNPIGFFALTSRYFSGQMQGDSFYESNLLEFKELVDALHENGIEVILDVVYNHTAEGNDKGPILNFKGMDNTVFYLLENNKKYYSNYSGTGNTLNCNHPVVKNMIIDSLHYWYGEVGVDGFRFDLGAILGRGEKGQWLGSENSLLNDIARDSVLARAKFFTEPWDASGGYFMGDFPENWCVWNGKFRDCIRSFVRGDEGQVNELIQRVLGSPDLFRYSGKKPKNSLNFITAHDGFTMWDLVSYNYKHNLANGEENRDGESHNSSWNNGFEGECTNEIINSLRKKQMKNLITLLMISRGVPMILMGDELGKTQKGNNNTYCQDNDLNWLDWERGKKFEDIGKFYREFIKFRKENRGLRQSEYRSRDGEISLHGIRSFQPDINHDSHSIGFMFEYEGEEEIYVAFNSYYKPLKFELPKIHEKEWKLIMDTSVQGESFLKNEKTLEENRILLEQRSCIIAVARRK
ncbi:MAG: glycogen debranching protein, partial [Fusobacteriaceae bacterium]